jgi:hypothetical protein
MSRLALLALLLTAATLLAPATAAAADHSLGLGIQYWKSLDDLVDEEFDDVDLDDDGFSYVASWRIEPEGIFSFAIDLEYSEDGFGGSTEESFTPLAYLLVGHGLYAGVGAGQTFSDGLSGDHSDLFFAARVGWELSLLPGVSVDFNANYRSDSFETLDEASSDGVTFGAIVRFAL